MQTKIVLNNEYYRTDTNLNISGNWTTVLEHYSYLY